MIRINLLSKEEIALADAVSKFQAEQYSKSFSERNPDLGKMIKCQICTRRHRSSQVCEQRFALYEDDTPVMAPLTGKSFLRSVGQLPKRINRHPNKFGLQLIERTRIVFHRDFPPIEDTPEEAAESLKLARKKAFKELQMARKSESRRIRLQQKESRRANRI